MSATKISRMEEDSPEPLTHALPGKSHAEEEFAILRWEDDGGASLLFFDKQLESIGENAKKPIDSSLNRKESVLAKPIYIGLAQHQIAETKWEYTDISAFLHEWSARFNDRFNLKLPVTPLRLDPDIRHNCAGYFRPGYNEFGLVYEIAIRVPPPEQIHDIDLGNLLGTLLHEELHLLQELTGVAGRNNYHNAEFRQTAERFGLVVDHRGHQTYDNDSPFLDLLAEFLIPPPRSVQMSLTAAKLATESVHPLLTPKRSGRFKLAKWSCGCTNARVGVANFHARCTLPGCGNLYVRC